MAKKNTKPKSPKRKKSKWESAQSFLPIRTICNGIVETTDGRYLKILEIEPINFALRSSEEQFNIISSFASWLKISPIRLQCKTICSPTARTCANCRHRRGRSRRPQSATRPVRPRT